MTVVVNTHNEQEEKVLIAFLNSLNYDYQAEKDAVILSNEQAAEILSRDEKFVNGKTTSRLWIDIRTELRNVHS